MISTVDGFEGLLSLAFGIDGLWPEKHHSGFYNRTTGPTLVHTSLAVSTLIWLTHVSFGSDSQH
jgi:hypothetical protein